MLVRSVTSAVAKFLLIAGLFVHNSIPANAWGFGPSTRDVDERIRRVENGLLLPVVVTGDPVLTMTLTNYNTPGVSIAFINNGKLEWTRAYGTRAAGGNDPVTVDTLFQAGSISKPVAAAMALRLIQEGSLTLDGNVNDKSRSWRVLENEFTREQKVTVHRILSHNAGHTNHAAGNYSAGQRYQPWSRS